MSQILPTDKEMLDLLNAGVAREFQVAIQYMIQHSKMEKIIQKVSPPNILPNKSVYDVFGDILYKMAIEEMKHAGLIMERIYLLNGHATTKADPPEIGMNIGDFAHNGLNRELEALDLYRKVINKAIELDDIETRLLGEQLYHDEEKHLLQFQEYLNLDKDLTFPLAPEAQWMKPYDAKYLTMLNSAISNELQSILQYTNQHEKANKIIHRTKNTHWEAVLDITKAEVISGLLRKIFLEEMKHLEKIADRIYRLNGECAIAPNPPPRVSPESTPEEWCLEDRKIEDQTIVLYQSIIAEADKLKDVATRKLFEDILLEEDKHFFDLDDYFAKVFSK